MNILLVEDDPVLARGLQLTLEAEGYGTIWADNLKSAFEKNEKEKLGLVILEINLADGSGFEFLNRVRERGSCLPIIILTAQIVNISHEICSSGQANFAGFQGTNEQKTALKDLFGADISKLSSQICEVGLVPGSDWDKTSINTAITQNIGKLTRWDDGNARSQTINNIQQIIDQGGVYYYKGNGETVTIPELKIPEGSGALTIIVENADLQINGNIEYSANTPATNAKQISSLGVIVINGNMYVAPSVSKLAGAYFVQRTLAETDVAAYLVGNIFSGNKADNKQDSEVQLTINGSIYGNIGPLFERRNAAGDINNDEGAITIRYDQRIIQNPPPGLSEILGSFSQSQIAQ